MEDQTISESSEHVERKKRSNERKIGASHENSNESTETPYSKYLKHYRRNYHYLWELKQDYADSEKQRKQVVHELKNLCIKMTLNESKEEAKQRFKKRKEELVKEKEDLKWKVLALHEALEYRKRRRYWARKNHHV